MATKIEGAYLILNSDNKLELHTGGRDAWARMPDAFKQAVKNSFIWGRQRGAWVSRSKGGSLPWRLKDYEIEYRGAQDVTDFDEAQQRKSERLENKADRYEARADRKEKEAERLRSEFRKNAEDWNWLTQPNVNTSRGRSFTRQREKVYARYDKGMRTSQYADRLNELAAGYRSAATMEQLKSVPYLVNRIDENEKALKMFEAFKEKYGPLIEKIDEQTDDWRMWLDGRMNHYKLAAQKLAFYRQALDKVNEGRKESGQLTTEDVEARMKTLKKEVSEMLLAKYRLKLLGMRKAFGKSTKTYYVIATDGALPGHLHSGWASDNKAQINVMKLIAEVDNFNKSKDENEKSQAAERLALLKKLIQDESDKGHQDFTGNIEKAAENVVKIQLRTDDSPYRDENHVNGSNPGLLLQDLSFFGYEGRGSLLRWMEDNVKLNNSSATRLRIAQAKAKAAAARIRILKLKDQ